MHITVLTVMTDEPLTPFHSDVGKAHILALASVALASVMLASVSLATVMMASVTLASAT